jgi:hypothetical protein
MKALSKGGAAIIAAFLLVLTSAFVEVQPAHAAGCTNEAIRAGQGTAALALPDCRAYELVTPGGQPFVGTDGGVEGTLASTTGSGLAYWTRYPAEAEVKSSQRYLAKRGVSGWSSESVAPQDSPVRSIAFNCEQALNFNSDLSESILSDGWNTELEDRLGQCGESEETLVPGAPRGYGNIFLREGGPGTPYKLINTTPPGTPPGNAVLRAYTTNMTHIVFEDDAKLTDGAPSGNDLYEWSAGTVHLISILPSGEAVPGVIADEGSSGVAQFNHAVSDNGEEIFFNANGNLYLRKNATQPPSLGGSCSLAEPNLACTTQVDQKRGGVGASGGGTFSVASPDGSRVIFSDASKLTADSQANVSKAGVKEPDLYELNVASGLLTDLTHTASTETPDFLRVGGFSEDGSMVYLVARGALAGSGANAAGEVAQPQQPNLYLYNGSRVSFIASAPPEQGPGEPRFAGGVPSPDGRYFGFGSSQSLTGFDNTIQGCSGSDCGASEIFRFDAQGETLECVSCGGASPTADAELSAPQAFTGKNAPGPSSLPRQVLDGGQVFFTTANALLPQDVNGAKDVYEYENGKLYMISSGTANGDSVFFDADPSGSNVFFATSQDLVRSDTSNGLSIYDARVEGGFPEPPPPPACKGEGCRGATPAPAGAAPTPASAGFVGAEEGPKHGRKPACKQGFMRRHGKCMKKHRHRAKHHHHKPTTHRRSKRRNAK